MSREDYAHDAHHHTPHLENQSFPQDAHGTRYLVAVHDDWKMTIEKRKKEGKKMCFFMVQKQEVER